MDVKEAIKTLEQATASCTTGDRHIVVLPSGFIFVGNLSYEEADKTYTVTDCQNVRKWSTGGIGGLCMSSKDSGAVLDRCAPVKFNAPRLVFAAPISVDW